MKILSDAAITKDDLQKVDDKHSISIANVKVAIGICTFANILISLALKYLL